MRPQRADPFTSVRLLLGLAGALSAWPSLPVQAQNSPPSVTKVRAQQRAETKWVDITYDVADADGDSLTISVEVSSDSGKTFRVPAVTLWGDVGVGVRPGNGKTITWDAGTDYPDQYGTSYLVRVLANDTPTVTDGYGDYVLLRAGPFEMGDNFNEGDVDEIPVHTVTLDACYIGRYEVTNGEYKRFIDDAGYTTEALWAAGGFGEYGSQPSYWTNSPYKGGGIEGNEEYPVVGVSWYEAMAYCAWLSARTGKTYRLSTEAEWEKAARGTDQRRYPWGNTIDGSYANYYNSRDPNDNGLTMVGFYDGTTRGSFVTRSNASPSEAYDLAGNVWEWCFDWYGAYSNAPDSNPTGPAAGTSRVVRGGGWDITVSGLRAANRAYSNPVNRGNFIGFRCRRAP